jgi:CRISPR-associated exonuclease Cas4
VPVERKSRTVSSSGPHDGEILQLAAYCLLVEEHFHKAVLRGQLQYRNRSIDIPFDDQLRRRLSNALDAMHEVEALRDVPRSHDSPARCRMCGHRSNCNQSLV